MGDFLQRIADYLQVKVVTARYQIRRNHLVKLADALSNVVKAGITLRLNLNLNDGTGGLLLVVADNRRIADNRPVGLQLLNGLLMPSRL